MSFELKPVDGYRPPRYPSPDPPGRPMIANRAAAWTLAAIAPLCSIAAVLPHPTTQQDAPATKPAPAPVQRLSEDEIAGLIGELREAQGRARMVKGEMVARTCTLTEQEARALLGAFLRKNGLDGRIDIAFLPGKAEGAIEELALLRARGEARVLILDGRNFEYDGDGYLGDTVPPKIGALQRLLSELEQFLNP